MALSFLLKTTSLACTLCFGMAYAQTTVVTTPSGTATSPDSPAVDVWLRSRVAGGALTGITTQYPRDGDGSVYLEGSDGSSAIRWSLAPAGGFGTLADLDSLSYDWYRDSSSNAPDHLHPPLQLVLQETPTSLPSYLTFERAYNPSVSAVDVDEWVSETITSSTILWRNGIENYSCTLGDYQAGTCAATSNITGATPIVGISFGIGSGWNGTFQGAVDNVSISMSGASPYHANFEVTAAPITPPAPTPVPTLSSLGSLIALSGALAWLAGRRRQALSNH